jgi:hypothetical protein
VTRTVAPLAAAALALLSSTPAHAAIPAQGASPEATVRTVPAARPVLVVAPVPAWRLDAVTRATPPVHGPAAQ